MRVLLSFLFENVRLRPLETHPRVLGRMGVWTCHEHRVGLMLIIGARSSGHRANRPKEYVMKSQAQVV